MSIRILSSLVIALLMSSSFGAFAAPVREFESTFQGPTVQSLTSYFSITGTDSITGYDWVNSFKSIDDIRCVGSACVYGNYGNNTFGSDAIAEITTDPDVPGNRVFHFQQNAAPDGTARLEFAFMYKPSGTVFKQGYTKYRMRLNDGFGALKNIADMVDWLTITEWWENQGDTSTQVSRVTFSINKASGIGQKIYWHLAMQDYLPSRKTIWYQMNKNVEVPINEWFTLEEYFKKGDASNGRVWIAITRDGQPQQVIFDVNNYTQNTTNPSVLRSWSFFKLYTIGSLVDMMKKNGTPLGIYYDDLEYWSDFPQALAAPMPPTLQ